MRVPVSRIVLVGLPGAGKTTVGRLLAERLGWGFVDPDREVERGEGLDIAAIFRTRGEAAFRRVEAEQVGRALGRERVVVAPGSGWLAQPGARAAVPPETVLVWLRVTPAEAARRLGWDGTPRPLLAPGDMATRLARLDGERRTAYEGADVVVETNDMTPEGVADVIATRLVSEYGIDGGAN